MTHRNIILRESQFNRIFAENSFSKTPILEYFKNKRRGDEFYTMYSDIEKEIGSYDFSNMVVYCNTDNPDSSKFVAYFKDNFEKSGIRKLMATFNSETPFLYEFDGVNERRTPIRSGLFQDNIELIRKCDAVVTNPPFSSRMPVKLMDMLIQEGKKFVIVAPFSIIQNNIVLQYVSQGNVLVGNNVLRKFETQNGGVEKITAVWWTNMPLNKPFLPFNATYDPSLYAKYDNFDAIDAKTNSIPSDYDGNIGVPISFILKYNPQQFEIVGKLNHPRIGGRNIMTRLIIRRR